MLIKHGACVNAMDLWQFTPLHEAASKSRIEVCSLLLSKGADPTLINCHSKSAIDLASTRELQERLSCKNQRLKNQILFLNTHIFADEFKGHCLMESCRIADVSKVKKLLNSDIAKFKHPLTGDTVFVSYEYIYSVLDKYYFYF